MLLKQGAGGAFGQAYAFIANSLPGNRPEAALCGLAAGA